LFEARLLLNLDLTSNMISGTIPPQILELLYLNVFRAGNNSLTGTLPGELFRMRQLSNLDLSFNRGLTGSLPQNMG
jgi:hypothetical protein